jgi:hypothetical protein
VRGDRHLDEALNHRGNSPVEDSRLTFPENLMRRSLFLLAGLLLGATPTRAQQPARGRIEGEVTDSVHARPLAGALVTATRVAPEPGQFFGTYTDDKGRFRFDTLTAGRYQITFVASFLDSIEVVLPSREVTLAAGQQLRVDMATPPGAVFRGAACPGLAPGRGAVTGDLVDAETEQPIAGGRLAVVWSDLSVDRTSLRVESAKRVGAVTADSLGRFWLCGVPTGTPLFAQVQADQVVGAVIELVVDDSLGITRRRLSLSRRDARRSSDSTVAAGADTAQPRPLTGTATLKGLVLGQGGHPVGGAHVRVADAAPVAVTDSLGHFTLPGLPAGTQVAEVRRLGYPRARAQVDLRRGQAVSVTVQLTRVVSLDSVRVMAQRTRYAEFEERRRSPNGMARFLDEADIARRNAFDTSELLRMMPGMRVQGTGVDAIIVSTRSSSLLGASCPVNVVIDRMPNMDINMVNPRDIAGMEVYASDAAVPPQYAGLGGSGCGAVIIWTKR